MTFDDLAWPSLQERFREQGRGRADSLTTDAPPPACLYTESTFSPFDRVDSVDPVEWARQHGQNGRLGGAIAGRHGLL